MARGKVCYTGCKIKDCFSLTQSVKGRKRESLSPFSSLWALAETGVPTPVSSSMEMVFSLFVWDFGRKPCDKLTLKQECGQAEGASEA